MVLFMITINIIGAGRLGKTIARLLSDNAKVTIQAICNQSLQSANDAISFIGQGKACAELSKLPPADVTLITTPDDEIKGVSERLACSESLKPGSTICHFSGALSSVILKNLSAKGCGIMSAHPMHSFAKAKLSVNSFSGSYCAVEGSEASLNLVTPLLESIGAVTFIVNSDKKSLYHSAGVIASNYLVTLCEQARLNLVESGIEPELAMKIATDLMGGTLQNLKTTLSPQQSLTGPIKRGDCATVSGHIDSISDSRRKLFYSFVGELTLDIAKLPADKNEQVKQALHLKPKL